MGEGRSGTSARHSSDAKTAGGTVNETAGISVIAPDDANMAPAEVESRPCDEAAQQLSACAWPTPLLDE
jgi:hypothetical protein